jgi:hypothetical protein
MSRRHWRRFRGNYFRSLNASLAALLWVVAVLVIPGLLFVGIPFTQLSILALFDISKESGTTGAICASLTGTGILLITASCNHERWLLLVKDGNPNWLHGLVWLFVCLVVDAIWILIGLSVFTLGAWLTATYPPKEQTWPIVTTACLSWVAGLFAVCVLANCATGKKDGPPFRGRRILSGKKQAQKRATKNRWSI